MSFRVDDSRTVWPNDRRCPMCEREIGMNVDTECDRIVWRERFLRGPKAKYTGIAVIKLMVDAERDCEKRFAERVLGRLR